MTDEIAHQRGTQIEQHLAWARQRGLRATTLYYRGNVLRGVEQSIGVRLVSATRSEIEAWFASLATSDSTRAVTFSHVKMFYRWAERFELRDDNPTHRLDPPVIRRRLPRPIPDDTLMRVLETADDRIRPWLYLAAYAGLRACEVAQLRAEDVVSGAEPPMLLVTDGKGGKQRLIPLHREVQRVLAESNLPAAGYLFLRVKDSGPARTSGLCDAPHVPPWLVSQMSNRHLRAQKAGATFHALRHRFGTQVYANSLDLRVTQELLGHSSPATTAGYAAWSPARGVAAVTALP